MRVWCIEILERESYVEFCFWFYIESDENCLPINCPKQLDKKFRFDNNLIVKNVFFVLSQLELVLSRLHDDVCFSVDLTLFLKEKSIFLSIGLTYLPLKYAILSEIMVQPYYK